MYNPFFPIFFFSTRDKNKRRHTAKCFTHISLLHWLREEADNNNGDDGEPEENQSKVHVMDFGYDGWTSVFLTTSRLQVSEVQDHAYGTNNESHNHTPECTLKYTANHWI